MHEPNTTIIIGDGRRALLWSATVHIIRGCYVIFQFTWFGYILVNICDTLDRCSVLCFGSSVLVLAEMMGGLGGLCVYFATG